MFAAVFGEYSQLVVCIIKIIDIPCQNFLNDDRAEFRVQERLYTYRVAYGPTWEYEMNQRNRKQAKQSRKWILPKV